MIDTGAIERLLGRAGLHGWASGVGRQIERRYLARPHGDNARWRQAIDRLPDAWTGRVAYRAGAVSLAPDEPLDEAASARLVAALAALRPWRKGPYRFGDVALDAEWRSDWKWERLRPHIAPLRGRLVLDVGCGNGYHGWLMALAGARAVVGLDPTALYVAQFAAVKRILAGADPRLAGRFEVLPLGIEDLPPGIAAFDAVFSMGVLYHRRSPLDHLLQLRGALRQGGQLVLETLVVEGGAERVLVPQGRYAKMRNVWFLPSVGMLETWLCRCGFRDAATVDVSQTTVQEQRATAWMTFESLADFLAPDDANRTVEGHPAPRRAICVAHC